MKKTNTPRTVLRAALFLALPSVAMASPITFETVSDDPGIGLDYERTRSPGYAVIQQFQQASLVTPIDFMAPGAFPHRTGGFPGVAIIDHDRDGDLDVYISNGPGTPNSLFVNQLVETGSLSFIDTGAASGAGAADQDSNGVCFGDLDNDGDDDLVVLGRNEANRLFANNGDGSFTQVTNPGIEGGATSHIGCTMGDIDNDGYLDLFVGNAIDLSNQLGIGPFPFDFNERNLLFKNTGNMSFTDVSASSGALDLAGIDSPDPQPATITWTVSMVDIDRDGDIDIVHGDDQAAVPSAEEPGGGVDRGLLHVLYNDGTGQFTDIPVDENDFSAGAWMGVDFGDFDCDGEIDMFSTNFGDYGQGAAASIFGFSSYDQGEEASRWMFNNGDQSWTDTLADGDAAVFGWGSAVVDLDNDGDQDVVYQGGLDMNVMAFEDNPGMILVNEGCSGSFTGHSTGFPDTDYRRIGTHGLATGDLDRDGRIDIVTSSEHRIPESVVMVPSPDTWGSVFDNTPSYWYEFFPTPDGLVWNGTEAEPGSMTLEMNHTEGTDGSVFLTARGGAGLISNGTVNRSGVGAVVSFTPFFGQQAISPVTAGSGYISQSALEQHFGMGDSPWGTADILWPGGVHNRLYFVWAGEQTTLPEIPCDIDTTDSYWTYRTCVNTSVYAYHAAGEIGWFDVVRLSLSATIAYWD